MDEQGTSGYRELSAPMRFTVAAGFWKRVRGLMFAKPDATVLLLVPCRDIHTFGMRGKIDVAFLDEKGVVLESRRNVPRRRRLRCKRACQVLERFAQADEPWVAAGETLCLLPRGKEEGR